MGVHYSCITGDYKVCTFMMDLAPHHHPHSGEGCAKALVAVLEEWGVTIWACTTDGASNMLKAFSPEVAAAVPAMKKILQLPCFGHNANTVWQHTKKNVVPAQGPAAGAAAAPAAPAGAGAGGSAAPEAAAALAPPRVAVRGAATRLSITGKLVKAVSSIVNTFTIGSARKQVWSAAFVATRGAESKVQYLVVLYSARWWAECAGIRRQVDNSDVIAAVDPDSLSFSKPAVKNDFVKLLRVVMESVPSLGKVLPVWERAAMWCTILSGRNYPTLGLVVPMLLDMADMIDDIRTSRQPKSAASPPSLAFKMALEFQPAWNGLFHPDDWIGNAEAGKPGVDYIRWAAATDPRVAPLLDSAPAWIAEMFEFASTHVSGWLTDKHLLIPEAGPSLKPAAAKQVAANVAAWQAAAAGADPAPAAPPARLSPWMEEKKVFCGLMGQLAAKGMDAVLATNPSEWYQSHSQVIPLTGRAFRKIHALQATEVSSEGSFSQASFIDSKHRHLREQSLRSLLKQHAWRHVSKPGEAAYTITIPKRWSALKEAEKKAFCKGFSAINEVMEIGAAEAEEILIKEKAVQAAAPAAGAAVEVADEDLEALALGQLEVDLEEAAAAAAQLAE